MLTLHTTPLAERQPGDDGDLGCAPVLGLRVSDYDCCSTEAWILVGPSLTEGLPSLLVEVVEARAVYYDEIRWDVVESLEAPSLADAVAAVVELADPGNRWGFQACPSCRDGY